MFAPDGSILPCTDKSKLIHCLEKLRINEAQQNAQAFVSVEHADEPETSLAPSESPKIAIVDGMVLVLKLAKKQDRISTVKDLGQQFNDRLLVLTANFDEVILVFDTYKADSLKQKTREKRQQGKDPIQYQINDNTNIKHIPMGRFLSHKQTKADLTEYLAQAVLKKNANSQRLFITSASGHTRSNRNMWFEENNHEEADTLMICLAAAAAQRCPKARMVIFSPDTDVLVLAVAHYEKLCTNTAVCMASGPLEIEPIWNALGREKATALMAFHAFTGADNVGRLWNWKKQMVSTVHES